MNTITDKARELERIMRENAKGNLSRLGGLGIDEDTGNLTVVPYAGNARTPPAIVHDPDMGGRFGGVDVQVAVIRGDDLEKVMGAATPVRGCAYTLDDEGVAQIVMSSNPLAKGTKSSVVFCTELRTEHLMDKNIRTDDLRFVVHKDSDEEEVTVSEIYNGEYRIVPNVMVIPTKARRFALGCGLLESPILENKKVLFLGCGSMGADMVSHIAQAGVGHIILCDMDRVEASNLNRLRDATLADCGRLKVDVLAERVRGKNPYCEITKVAIDITQNEAMMDELLSGVDLAIVSTDNHASRTIMAKSLERVKRPCIYTRCTTRAESGDILITRPGECCYNCLFTQGADDAVDDWASAKKAGRLAAYARPEDMKHYKALPGISTDISSITSFAARLAIWELAKDDDENPFAELNAEFMGFNYFLFVNRREYVFKSSSWAPFDDSGHGKICPLRWYGARIPRMENCCTCGMAKGMLDSGEEESGLEAMCKAGFAKIANKH